MKIANTNKKYSYIIVIGYSLNNRNVSIFKMFHLIWAIIFIIKLYKSVANATNKKALLL